MTRNLGIVLAIVALFTIPLNNHICDYVYPNNDDLSIRAWWYLKEDVYGVVIALLFIAYSLSSKGILRFILDVGAGVSVSNVIDRLYFSTREFTKADIFMIIVTLIIATIDYKKDELTTDKQRDTDKYSKGSRGTS